ncbi:hypothetical protein B4589_009790 [Halolamina sp. CBA1230]|uniref:hypothetical protein n=1 Tax=Halolamina sp. CBA1230 TaxID=1853690 RepID=UPI0009A19B88|nr:hypothetical protein [Halolamina sp. CBA1230]QKY20656.1 hypothetical protein B4589_009790 [Halolamina sp. CBA1230]
MYITDEELREVQEKDTHEAVRTLISEYDAVLFELLRNDRRVDLKLHDALLEAIVQDAVEELSMDSIREIKSVDDPEVSVSVEVNFDES